MKKYKLGLLFGTFDPLHFGHIRLMRRSKAVCEKIVVLLDSDDLIRSIKGREPYSTFEHRMEDILAIKYVDFIRIESVEMTKEYWIEMLQPDILIKGDNWKGKHWSGEGLGVPVLYLPSTADISSTKIRKMIKKI